MQTLRNIITPDDVQCGVQAGSKKHCLEIVSELLARRAPNASLDDIFTSLTDRERLGCTAVGEGMAFPHARVAGVDRPHGAFLRLAEPIEYEAPDGMPVDLVFGLLVPAEPNERERADIAELARLLADDRLRTELRAAPDSAALYDVLTGGADSPRRRSAGARG